MKLNLATMISQFNQLELKVRLSVFAGVLLMLVLADVFTVLGFQWGALQKIGQDNQTLHDDIERLKGDLLRIDQMRSGLQNSRTQLEGMNSKIHSVGEVSPILEDVSKIANQAGVKIEQLTPQSDAQQALITSGAVKYYALPIVVQATSGYHMFGHWMNQLESAALFFNLSSLTIEDQGGDVNHHRINATFKVVLSDKNTDGPKK